MPAKSPPQKRHRRTRSRRVREFTPGVVVVPEATGLIEGVDPFTMLVVTGINDDRTLALAQLNGGPHIWPSVPADLVAIHVV